MKTALITGIDGQDGSYLADLLLQKGYRIIGWVHPVYPLNIANIRHLAGKIELVQGTLHDQPAMERCLQAYQPDEVYNFASPSSPYASWEEPLEVAEAAGLGVTRLLEAIRKVDPDTRFYQASSSEMFGIPPVEPQTEDTPFNPRNPYGVAKLYAHFTVANYRRQYGLFGLSGILFNHESPRRGSQFVTRKITRTAALIKLGLARELRLGDLEARRDWGYAPDYVRAIWMMLQADAPQDYVIGTGVTHSVREFCELAFKCLQLDYRDFVIQDPALMRPPETHQLVANPRRARRDLGWNPEVPFAEIVQRMVFADLASATDPQDDRPSPFNPITI